MAKFGIRFPGYLVVIIPVCALVSACGSEPASGNASTNEVRGRPLPNWATDEELLQAQTPETGLGTIQQGISAPPPSGTFRVPAEFEPTKAVVMAWTWYTDLLQEISAAVASSGAEVWMVGGPSRIPGVPAEKYKALDYDFNSVWVRDYGPVGIDLAARTVGIVDTRYRHYRTRRADDAVPCQIADDVGATCYSTTLIDDGGNFMMDGKGNLFMTRRLYEWNPKYTEAQVDQMLRDYVGAKNIYAFDYAKERNGTPADGTGHIDMFAKIVDECKVLVAETDAKPFATPLEQAAEVFANLECRPGKKYEVYRVNGWASDGVWYTYTNSLIVNRVVIVPSYSGADNEAARQVYLQALPGYDVQMLNTDASIVNGGSIHCVTKEIPQVQ